ncbi:unnamed protein product [Peronospora effusa]|nr:unnamed protein product [Peronospora effusa]
MTAFAKNLQAAQVRYWHSQGMSAGQVFGNLHLGLEKEKLFENPLFHRLIDFIKSTTPDKTTSSVYPTLYSTLSTEFDDNILLVTTLIEETNAGRKNSFAPKLLLLRLLESQLTAEPKEIKAMLKKLKTGSQDTNGPLRITSKKFFDFFNREKSQWSDLTQLKEMFGESKTAEMLATTNEKSSEAERAKQLLDKQFSFWWNDPDMKFTNLINNKLVRDGISEDVATRIIQKYRDKWFPRG